METAVGLSKIGSVLAIAIGGAFPASEPNQHVTREEPHVEQDPHTQARLFSSPVISALPPLKSTSNKTPGTADFRSSATHDASDELKTNWVVLQRTQGQQLHYEYCFTLLDPPSNQALRVTVQRREPQAGARHARAKITLPNTDDRLDTQLASSKTSIRF
jgi:hypothetical protein